MFTKENLDQYIRRQWAEKGYEFSDRERVGISIDELVSLSVERNTKAETPYLDLWIRILDEFISWEISFHVIFMLNGEKQVKDSQI